MKVIAFYLPQFHPIPENDRWWGAGFTEWTKTRGATPLFPGHYEPREPLGDHYYNLLDEKARAWQADLARSYGIYGFCYYHYWFRGHRLLEKPFAEVLRTGQPDFPFCLSWANESWSRVWNGRRWDILMPQDYGEAGDWRRHFEELLPAFEDPRYIRIDGKPLFIIYRPSHIPRCTEMLELWRTLARESGLEGLQLLHVLNTFEPRRVPGFAGTIDLEPMYTISHRMPRLWRWRRYLRATMLRLTRRRADTPGSPFMDLIDYDETWEKILDRPRRPGPELTIPGAFADWDNTPRRGNRGTVFVGATPEKFERYLTRQLARARQIEGSGYLFVNAWNEWAEGAYLEPDKRFGLEYLEAVRRALSRVQSEPSVVIEPAAPPRETRASKISPPRVGRR
jgi:lipopolysaccharide biosynthesis protein